jgi:hypothetical protein
VKGIAVAENKRWPAVGEGVAEENGSKRVSGEVTEQRGNRERY